MRLALGVVLATVLSYPLGLLLGGGILLPVLNTAAAYAAMVVLLRRGERRQAVGLMLAWAATLAVCATVTFAVWPSAPDTLVLNGPPYRDEMFHWIRTGEGREGRPAEFIPQHVLHLAGFVVLSLATASAASMALGAALMNYMGFYVASLYRAGVPARRRRCSRVAAVGDLPRGGVRRARRGPRRAAALAPVAVRLRRDFDRRGPS